MYFVIYYLSDVDPEYFQFSLVESGVKRPIFTHDLDICGQNVLCFYYNSYYDNFKLVHNYHFYYNLFRLFTSSTSYTKI